MEYLNKLTNFLELYLYTKAPRIPEKWRLLYAKILPYLVLIFFVLTLPFILTLLGISTAFMPIGYLTTGAYNYGLPSIILLVSLVVEAMAIPGLFKRQKRGWDLLYYSTLLSTLYNLSLMNIFGTILGTLISFYLLFQIREYYKS